MASSDNVLPTRTVETDDDVHYTVFVRLPFARGDFVDPPAVEWNAKKDRELWEILARSSVKGQDLDWDQLAHHFDVTLSFLSQQAAWLYEQQLSQVRAQLRKVNRQSSIGTSPTPGSDSGSGTVGGYPMTRGGSGGSRVPSSLSHRSKDRTSSHGESGTSKSIPPGGIRVLGGRLLHAHPTGLPLSRMSSTNTIKQTQIQPRASQHSPPEVKPSQYSRRQSRETAHRSTDASPRFDKPPLERISSSSAIGSSSSSTESETQAPTSRSRTFARRPRYSSARLHQNPLSDADEEGEDSPPFLPFSDNRPTTPPRQPDPGATLRMSPRQLQKRIVTAPTVKGKTAAPPQTVHSSSSSAQSQPQTRNPPLPNRPPGLSPQQRRLAKEAGSDGTLSMGSSFSDLDDASVTQSALEEALAGEMQHGGVASRMSMISQALRSRYL